MDRYIWFLPPLAAGISALVTRIQLPSLLQPRYLNRPDESIWAFWQLLDDDRFTEEGVQLRNRYALHGLRFLLCGLIGFAVAGAIASRQ